LVALALVVLTLAACAATADQTAGGHPSAARLGTPSALVGGEPLAHVDWDVVARHALGCAPASGPKWDHLDVRLTYIDVTGDGVKDALVTAGCPSPTSSNPIYVAIFDGASSPAAPRLVAVLGRSYYFRTVVVMVVGSTITMKGQALSANAAFCCPDERLTVTFMRHGSTFVQSAHRSMPMS
jgi:hypothetical protein